MRNIAIHHDTGFCFTLVGLLLLLLLVLQPPVKAQMWVYPFVRQATATKLDYQSRRMDTWETEHFTIRYTQADARIVAMVATAAEQAYGSVTSILGCQPDSKSMIIIYPDKKQLRNVFGWSSEQSAMGVYWGGVIQLLSPRIWLYESNSLQEFIYAGPMVHEFTHLVFDYMTNGNYPRWFTEGLAQYVEYKVNGYQWLTSSNGLNRPLYSMAELEKNFDGLDNPALAYRQSLAAVRYIAEQHGENKLKMVIGALREGENIKDAIQHATGLDYASYEAAWQSWAIGFMMEH